jgi:hypothetical protein
MKLWLLGAFLMVWAASYGVFNGMSLLGLGIITWAVIRRFREERSNA